MTKYIIFALLVLFPLSLYGEHSVKLYPITVKDCIPLNEAILQRRSVRNLSSKPLTLYQISQLLWAAQGITDYHNKLRAAPSAGALYPLKIYMATHLGIWHYDVKQHAIDLIVQGDLRTQLTQAAYHQNSIKQAPVNIIITADFNRETTKYRDKGIQFTYIEVGHVAQNILLETANLGLGSVPIGAFDVKQINQTLHLPKNETTLYIIPIGYQEKNAL